MIVIRSPLKKESEKHKTKFSLKGNLHTFPLKKKRMRKEMFASEGFFPSS